MIKYKTPRERYQELMVELKMLDDGYIFRREEIRCQMRELARQLYNNELKAVGEVAK